MRSSFVTLLPLAMLPLALLAATASLQAPVEAAPFHGAGFPPPGGMTEPTGPARPIPNLPTGVSGGYRGPAGGRAAAGPGSGPRPVGVPGAGQPRPGPMTPGATPGAPGRGRTGPGTLGPDDLRDRTSWRLWWEFNKEAYLRLGSLRMRDRQTGDDDFFLGQGQRDLGPQWRVSQATVEERIIPALTTTSPLLPH